MLNITEHYFYFIMTEMLCVGRCLSIMCGRVERKKNTSPIGEVLIAMTEILFDAFFRPNHATLVI
jgi:hypothetical protein